MMHEQQRPRRFQWLAPVSLIFIGIVFGSHYIMFPLALVARIMEKIPLQLWLKQLLRWPFIGFYAALYAINLLFTDLSAYLALSVIGLALALAALAFARPTQLGRVGLLLGLLAILAMPITRQYRSAVVTSSDSVHIDVPTQPGLLNGVVKAAQVGVEMRRCDYKLLGWSKQDALYGEETCGTHHRLWVYWPMSDSSLQAVSTVPTELLRQEISREELRAEGVRSGVPTDDALRIVVREPGLASQAGGWYAFVARHIYGPEDVVVIMR